MLNSSGVTTFSTSNLSPASHAITAVYGDNGTFLSSNSPTVFQVVDEAGTNTSLTSSVNPSTFGQMVTFTATVSSAAGTPAGTVTILDGATTLGTGTLNSSGVATFGTSNLSAASHAITAVYGDNGTFLSSTSPIVSQVVNQASTNTTLTSSLNPSQLGESVTFTATVTSAAGNPSGTVTFVDGSTTLGTGTLNSGGSATFSTSSLSVGSHAIRAVYAVGGNFLGGISPIVTQVVNRSTSARLTSSADPSVYGQPVTFTAVVTSASGAPSGTVAFVDGSTTLGVGTLSSGPATFTTSSLSVGSHSITAVYAGDSDSSASTSPTLTQVVNKASTSTKLTSSLNPAVFGQSVTFTATVSSAFVTPMGTVTFNDGSLTLGTGTLDSSGVATFSTSSLSVASHSIIAVYVGNNSFLSSTSRPLTEVVNKASTSTTLTSSTNPAVFGQSVIFTARVTSVGGTPTGIATFKNGSLTLGAAPLNSSGIATFSTSNLSVAFHAIVAEYAASGNFLGSTSPTLIQVVNKASSSTTLTSSINPSTFGQSVTFTAMVTSSSATPTGMVTFKDGTITLGAARFDGSGVATFSTSRLSVASHSITAVYAANGDFLGSLSPILTQVVGPASTITALTSSANPSVIGHSVTFIANVNSVGGTPTGTVQFQVNGSNLGSPVALVGGRASLSTSRLTVGNSSITAVYSGSRSYLGSQGTLTQTALIHVTRLRVSETPMVQPGIPFTMTVLALNGLAMPITALVGQQATLSPSTSSVQLTGNLTATFDANGIVVFPDLQLSGAGRLTLTLVINNVDAPQAITLTP